MALLSPETLAGTGFIVLNVLRGMNIIALLSVVGASVVMLVKTFVVSKFFFFDATTHVVTAVASLFLIVSECSIFRSYFARNWPLLSPSHGFVSLGVAMIILGLNMLGNMNKEATSQESLGMPFWRLLLASGILGIIVGLFNIVASYIFRDTSRQLTARRVRAHGADQPPSFTTSDFSSDPKALSIHRTGSSASRTLTSPHPITLASPQKTRFSFAAFSPARTFRNARASILPSYSRHDNATPNPNTISIPNDDATVRDSFAPPPTTGPSRTFSNASTNANPHRLSRSSSSSSYSRFTSGEPRKGGGRNSSVPAMPRLPLQISAPMNVNPQFAHLVRPDLAHHPSQRRPEGEGYGGMI